MFTRVLKPERKEANTQTDTYSRQTDTVNGMSTFLNSWLLSCPNIKGSSIYINLFYAPVTIVGGIKICPCLSVCPSVRHALRYRVCVINCSHSFQWIFLKPCISVVDILKMCIWVLDGAKINFDRTTAFRT